MDKLADTGIIPVVVLEHAADAVPAAKALLAGGVGAMEITFRTAAAPDAIEAVSKECPEMLVGAGTVITLEQCRQAVSLGARFIVSPGVDEEVVRWCVENNVAVTPGCVTPSEIMSAMKLGIDVVKFFPASVYGGLKAMKALAGPFGKLKFIPTGGIDASNCGEYAASPFVHAIGGSWICTKADIAAHQFDRITTLSRDARKAMLGFEVAHIGINSDNADTARDVCSELEEAFGFPVREGSGSFFVSPEIEIMKSVYLGKNGHIAVRTNRIEMGIKELERKGYVFHKDAVKYQGDRLIAAYMEKEFGGFAVHLLQR